MTPDRDKPGVAFWATVLLVVLAGYLLSLWPAIWIGSRFPVVSPALHIYCPLVVVERNLPPTWQMGIARFLGSAVPPHRILRIDDWTISIIDLPV